MKKLKKLLTKEFPSMIFLKVIFLLSLMLCQIKIQR